VSNRRLLLVWFILSLLGCACFVLRVNGSDQNSAASALNGAEGTVASAYEAVLEAEKAGGNITSLFVRLNDAGEVLASGRMSYRNGDFDTATMLAGLSENIGGQVQNDAISLKNSTLRDNSQHSLFTVVSSVVAIASIVFGSVGIWHVLKKRLMNYRGLFVVGSLGLILLAAVPASAMYIHLPSGSERFSELWLLGPSHKAEDYPFDAGVNRTYSVYVGVGNHLGHSGYYRVCVKFRNETQPLPVDSNATPSVLPTLYEFDFFVRDSETWETPLNFTITNAERSNNFLTLKSLSIDEVTFFVNSYSYWDTVRGGFYYQLFFELWLYNMTSQSFQYNSRFISLWLNMTF
jgi:uncharacterized membrane protein